MYQNLTKYTAIPTPVNTLLVLQVTHNSVKPQIVAAAADHVPSQRTFVPSYYAQL